MIAISRTVELLKTDRRLGIAYGFAIVCSMVKDSKVEDYYDLQGDNIPEEVMIKAACEFSMGERIGKAQHQGDKVADIVFMFPLTADIAKGLGITSDRYGLLIGYKPTSAKVLEDIDAGIYSGFSLGGTGIRQEVA